MAKSKPAASAPHLPIASALRARRKRLGLTLQELADKSDQELAETVLWSACCDIRESGEWLGLVR